MRITWNELAVGFAAGDAGGFLSEWRWLVGDSVKLLLISSLGDLFLEEADGSVWWLDAGSGNHTRIAGSSPEFKTMIQDRENADNWFVPQLIGDLISSGKRLAPGQCYSYRVPPVLGGKIEPANFEPTDLIVHFGTLGQIHKQVKDLPEGAGISGIRFG